MSPKLALEALDSTHFFHYPSSIGRLDSVRSFLKILPRSRPAHGIDADDLFVATGGTSSAPTLIALRGEVTGHKRRMKARPVSAVSIPRFCDLSAGLMSSAPGIFLIVSSYQYCNQMRVIEAFSWVLFGLCTYDISYGPNELPLKRAFDDSSHHLLHYCDQPYEHRRSKGGPPICLA